MKKIINTILATLITFFAISQPSGFSISPNVSNDICPNVKMQFEVIIYNVADNNAWVQGSALNGPAVNVIVGTANRTVDQNLKTTKITFDGYFFDQNSNHTLQVNYSYVVTKKDKDGNDYQETIKETKDFVWKNIKSLQQYSNAARVNPNTSVPIIAKRCISEDIPFTFPKCKFENVTETNQHPGSPYTYGQINNYKYKIPAGWGLKEFGNLLQPTNGWYQAGNNVVLVSDVSTGDKGEIQIYPLNDCTPSNFLNKPVDGQITQIPISRPAPTLVINGSTTICSSSPVQQFSVTGLTNGATVSWSSSNTAFATVSPTNGATISVTKTGIGITTINATVTDCYGTYPGLTFPITLGIPNISILGTTYTTGRFSTKATYLPGAKYKWYLSNVYNAGFGDRSSVLDELTCNVPYPLQVAASNICGVTPKAGTQIYQKCVKGTYLRYAINQHPTIGNTITIGVDQTTLDEQAKLFFDATALEVEQIQNVRIVDKEGQVVMDIENIGTQLTNIDLSTLTEGVYTIIISGNNDYKEQQSYSYTLAKTPQQLAEELAEDNILIVDVDAAKLKEVLKQELYEKLKTDDALLNGSTVLQSFMLTRKQGDFGTIESINEALSTYDVTTAQTIINNWLPTSQLELNCLQYYNYFINYLNGGTFPSQDLTNMYNLANLCPQKHGEIIFAVRSLYNYITQLDETFETACGNNLARGYVKVDAKAKVGVNSISIYPNPSKGNFNIKFPSTSRGINTIKVLDQFGKIIMEQTVIGGTKNLNINKTLASGIYMVQITNSVTNKTETQKLIINN